MSISHRTNRLKLFGTPAVEQLQNGRYQLTVNCTTMNSREDWYSANKARIFPSFGSFQGAAMNIDGLQPRTGEAYTDMNLVSVQSSTQGEDYIVTLVYQTLGATFVQVKDDDISEGENGLRIVKRTIIAEAGTDYVDGSTPPALKQVGFTTINSQVNAENAISCTLASYEIVDTDSYREVKEVYMQPGTLSETKDKVGSQLSIVKETFASTPAAISGYSIANERESNVDGIPTKQFTFLKDDVKLSDSEDKVGSQNAITEQWFKPVASDPGATPPVVGREIKAGYSLAKEEISDVQGIPTKRFTFLKPSILSVQKELNSGLRKVSVRAFDLTETQVRSILISDPPQSTDTLPNGSSLISEETSDFDGIETRIFNFEFHEVFTESYDLNGLKRIEQRKFSLSDFTAGVIGGIAGVAATPPATDPPNVVPAGSPVIGLYLSTEEIDNGGDVKTKVSNWIESGTLKEETRNISDGLVEHTTKYIGAKGTAVGPVVDESIDNFEGLQLFNVVDIRTPSGTAPVPTPNTPRLVNSFDRNVTFKYPGVASIQHDQLYVSNSSYVNVISTVMRPPVEATVTAQADVYIQDSGSIVAADYIHTPSGSSTASYGFWNPTSWAEVYQGGVGWGNAPFSETQALRGYRADLNISNVSTINSNNSVRTYVSNGVIISQRRIASLTAYNVLVNGVATDAYVVGTADNNGYQFAMNSRRLYGGTPFQMRLNGGPVNPSNKQWVLDVKIEPAFEGSDGTQLYRKTILTSSIP